MSLRKRIKEVTREAKENDRHHTVFGKGNFFAQRHIWVTVGFMIGWFAYKKAEAHLYRVDEMVPFHNLFIAKVGLFIMGLVLIYLLGVVISIVLRFFAPLYRYLRQAKEGQLAAKHAGDSHAYSDYP